MPTSVVTNLDSINTNLTWSTTMSQTNCKKWVEWSIKSKGFILIILAQKFMKNHLEMTQIRDKDIDWSPTNLLQMKIDGKRKLFSSELLVTSFMN